MKISVITPSVRIAELELVEKSLKKQTFTEYEWIVVSPFEKKDCVWIKEPEKRPGDFYNLCKAYNAGFRKAKGELIVSWQDGIWADPTTLQSFWDLYESDKTICVGAIGDQYAKVDAFGKPEILYWRDPRRTDKYGSFYEVNPIDIEWTLASFPKKALEGCKGFKEVGDRFAALFEKELNIRMDLLGYKFYLDQSLNYRAIHHDRLSGKEEWDKHYFEGHKYFDQCIEDLKTNKGLYGDL